MRTAKAFLSTGGILTVLSVLLFISNSANGIQAMIRCLTLAFGIMLMTRGVLLLLHVKQRSALWLYGVGVLFMSCYTLLALDTYVFHVMQWFPGIIRYPLFSLYGISYLLFALPGIFLHVGSSGNDVWVTSYESVLQQGQGLFIQYWIHFPDYS